MLGPYASWNKNTGYAVWDNPTAEHVGIFERINVGIKGIIHVGMWDFIEYGCYTKLVGNNVIGVEANPQGEAKEEVAENEETTKQKEQECDLIRIDIVNLQTKVQELDEKINSIPAEIIDVVGVRTILDNTTEQYNDLVLFHEQQQETLTGKREVLDNIKKFIDDFDIDVYNDRQENIENLTEILDQINTDLGILQREQKNIQDKSNMCIQIILLEF